MPPSKRPRIEDNDKEDEAHHINDEEIEESENESSGEETGASGSSGSDSEKDIHNLKPQKSHQTKKRKLRATAPSAFGTTLQSLLNTDAPSSLPLSLKPSISRKRNDEKLESRAKQVLQLEKKEKEDQGRITDVIGGWGAESERGLRKVAQRGVVKLFNVIQQSQSEVIATAEKTKKSRGSGKPTLPAPVVEPTKGKDNLLGRSKANKESFFDAIRSGGIVSKG